MRIVKGIEEEKQMDGRYTFWRDRNHEQEYKVEY